jgi:hypothetical protein
VKEVEGCFFCGGVSMLWQKSEIQKRTVLDLLALISSRLVLI